MSGYSKLLISGDIEVLSGLHIGTGAAFSAIGAADSSVIKDQLTGLPIIPGSSLKGKMRSLLAKFYNEQIASSPNEDSEKIRKLFGDTEEFKVGKLIFRDAPLMNDEELIQNGAESVTEIKFENTIDRKSAIANPRQIERVIPGAKFKLELIYNLEDVTEFEEDLDIILNGLRLLEFDYLGGNGTRGYGKVKFLNLSIEELIGDSKIDVQSVNEKLKD